MTVFQIRQGETSSILWTGEAASEIQAMDAMAHDAGYYDLSDLPENMRRGLKVEALSFGTDRGQASAGRAQGGRTGQFVMGTSINDRNLGRAAG
ncbi:hypothetical protein [Methylorubrum extorquens]|uniref:hypothetical protein n=1 Tax=Methylorubrum extorquens TaxID=408 RepID=UPI000158F8A4|nr:hypothetical protein [Methylorubrum extorquens]ABY30820.1 hypothetical protein Mext_2425 [Methylorubrum extorquens PA1]KQP87551.1 hypothetical protein ASF55_06905 [Methylobacterium sp. Leaf119]WIU42081.1 hypothetical protein KQ926_12630 [Methylorubrum extorquens]